jgi:hypothetical protein
LAVIALFTTVNFRVARDPLSTAALADYVYHRAGEQIDNRADP